MLGKGLEDCERLGEDGTRGCSLVTGRAWVMLGKGWMGVEGWVGDGVGGWSYVAGRSGLS